MEVLIMTHDSSILYKPFSIKAHKEAFENTYLEASISPEGIVEYAIPSHQEFLINKLCKIKNKSRNQIMNEVPEEYYFDMMEYFWKETYNGRIRRKHR